MLYVRLTSCSRVFRSYGDLTMHWRWRVANCRPMLDAYVPHLLLNEASGLFCDLNQTTALIYSSFTTSNLETGGPILNRFPRNSMCMRETENITLGKRLENLKIWSVTKQEIGYLPHRSRTSYQTFVYTESPREGRCCKQIRVDVLQQWNKCQGFNTI